MFGHERSQCPHRNPGSQRLRIPPHPRVRSAGPTRPAEVRLVIGRSLPTAGPPTRRDDLMREVFHAKLDALSDHTAAMCESAATLLKHASRSVCDTDQAQAELVIATASTEMDRQRGHAEEMVVELLALQAPVASDLRRVVSALWIVGDVDRIRVLAN